VQDEFVRNESIGLNSEEREADVPYSQHRIVHAPLVGSQLVVVGGHKWVGFLRLLYMEIRRQGNRVSEETATMLGVIVGVLD